MDLQNGAGNSNQKQYYQFIDKTPILYTRYYRIKQVDYDGSTGYSKVISATPKNIRLSLNNTYVYPNPASSFIYVQSKEDLSENDIVVTNAMGESVNVSKIKLERNNTTYKVNIEHLSSDIYNIKVKGCFYHFCKK